MAYYNWLVDGGAYLTRAEAAQEAYADDDLSKLTTQWKPTEEAMESADHPRFAHRRK